MIPDLAQWDVVRVRIRPGDKDLHPAVVISRSEVCQDARKQSINVVYGSTRRPAGGGTATDVTLNGADGLERATLFNCDHLLSRCAKTLWIHATAASLTNAAAP